jgi:succinate dehydrogenase / fumarate reductase flavoprotein subunit
MWQHCGVVRDARGLEMGLDELVAIKAKVADVDVRPTSEGFGDLAHVLDLRASLVSAEATLRAALARPETRGAHIRSDHPDLDPDLRVNIIVRGHGEEPAIAARPVPPIDEALRPLVEEAPIESFAGRLLE